MTSHFITHMGLIITMLVCLSFLGGETQTTSAAMATMFEKRASNAFTLGLDLLGLLTLSSLSPIVFNPSSLDGQFKLVSSFYFQAFVFIFLSMICSCLFGYSKEYIHKNEEYNQSVESAFTSHGPFKKSATNWVTYKLGTKDLLMMDKLHNQNKLISAAGMTNNCKVEILPEMSEEQEDAIVVEDEAIMTAIETEDVSLNESETTAAEESESTMNKRRGVVWISDEAFHGRWGAGQILCLDTALNRFYACQFLTFIQTFIVFPSSLLQVFPLDSAQFDLSWWHVRVVFLNFSMCATLGSLVCHWIYKFSTRGISCIMRTCCKSTEGRADDAMIYPLFLMCLLRVPLIFTLVAWTNYKPYKYSNSNTDSRSLIGDYGFIFCVTLFAWSHSLITSLTDIAIGRERVRRLALPEKGDPLSSCGGTSL